MQKFALTAEISTKVAGGGATFCVHPVHLHKFVELQVKCRDGEWIDAVPMANTVLVFIDDVMQRWTADRLVATVYSCKFRLSA